MQLFSPDSSGRHFVSKLPLNNENKITKMTNNPHAISWNSEEFEKLVELVKPHPCLYHVQDPSRKNILAREATWEQISQELSKPVEDCKKRWKALRDGYMKTQRLGNERKITTGLFTKLDFLNEPEKTVDSEEHLKPEETEQEVIMDKQEYYEIMVVENLEPTKLPKMLIPALDPEEPPKKIKKGHCGRKKSIPPPVGLPPIKILPKPMVLPKFIQYVEDKPKPPHPPPPAPPTPQPNKSEVLDSLIEKVLKEHTNEIDVFFRSMAASVKKLQPNLIPKVKMEVCNVIAKYEMQSFEKNSSYI